MRKKFISADFLKIFAVLLMVTDHASEVIIENNLMCNTSSIEELVYWVKINEVLRGIGRLGFPIFAFLLVEGILHTHDVKKYITRMAVFAVISEIPYDYACNGGFTWAGQNIFLTLTLALIMIVVFQKIEKKTMGRRAEVAGNLCCMSDFCCNKYGLRRRLWRQRHFYDRSYLFLAESPTGSVHPRSGSLPWFQLCGPVCSDMDGRRAEGAALGSEHDGCGGGMACNIRFYLYFLL